MKLLLIGVVALIATGASAHEGCWQTFSGALVCLHDNDPPPAPVVAPPAAIDWCHIRQNGEIWCDGDDSLGMK